MAEKDGGQDDELYISVSVYVDSRVILKSWVVNVNSKMTFSNLIEKLQHDERVLGSSTTGIPATVPRIFVSCTPDGNMNEATANLLMTKCCKNFGMYVTLRFKGSEHQESRPQENAFRLLMQSAQVDSLPSKYTSPSRNDWQMFNDIVDLMSEKKMGFPKGSENESGKRIIDKVTGVLYYLNPVSRQAILSKNAGLNVKQLGILECFFAKNYNDPSRSKKKLPQMTALDLKRYTSDLATVLEHPSLARKKMEPLHTSLTLLNTVLRKYTHHLGTVLQKMKANHESSTPVRTTSDGTSTFLKVIEGAPRTEQERLRYSIMQKS